jgi:tRNA G18 (ribose-2'-O)-methylase SpoU
VPMIRRLVGFEFHRGCLAAGERGEAGPTSDLLSGRLLVVLERTTSPDNVGAVFRNAGAFGADGVLLSPGCGDPLYRRAIRVSMGGSLHVPFAVLGEWPGGLAELRDAGFTIVALTPDGGADIGDFGRSRRLPDRVALVLGSEGDGVSPGARAAADLEVAIPLAPGDHSLNLATACGIALHRFARWEGPWT